MARARSSLFLQGGVRHGLPHMIGEAFQPARNGHLVDHSRELVEMRRPEPQDLVCVGVRRKCIRNPAPAQDSAQIVHRDVAAASHLITLVRGIQGRILAPPKVASRLRDRGPSMTAFQFPIPVRPPPGGCGARPLFALRAAGGRRCAERITNVRNPRRSFFSFLPDRVRTPAVGAAVRLPAPGRKIERALFCLPGDLVSSPAQIAREILNSVSSAHHRLRFRQHGSTGELGDVPKIMGGPHGGGC